MTIQGKKKSERHHWWPVCVSEHWKDPTGMVHWVSPTGEVKKAPPKQFGLIGNGHHIKLGRNGEPTPWDQNFEPIFNVADSNFPSVIQWLKSLEKIDRLGTHSLTDRFIPQVDNDNQIARLVECIVSLAIRSPKQRETAVGVAETIRGPLSKKERNTLIALNMRDSHTRAVSLIGTRGKFVILHSPNQEFIFGDGFFHNIRSPVQFSLNSPKILVPITPEISVLYARPRQYLVEPRLFTLMINAEEATLLNEAVQIYSSQFLFFRAEKPEIISDYTCGEHLEYADSANPIDNLISAIPGVRDNRLF